MNFKEEYQKQLDEVSFSADFEQTAAQKMRMAGESEKRKMKMSKRTKIIIAAAAAILLFSTTAFAAPAIISRLTPQQVAEKTEINGFIEAFNASDAVIRNETVENNGWRITLLGTASGEELNDYASKLKNELVRDDNGAEYVAIPFELELDECRTYAAVAVEKADGTPLTEDSDVPTLTVVADGYKPWRINSWTFGFSATGFVENGIAYRIIDFADFGILGGGNVRLAAHDTFAPERDTFASAADGTVCYADGYTGTKAMFSLPVEKIEIDSETQAMIDFLNDTDVEYVSSLDEVDGLLVG